MEQTANDYAERIERTSQILKSDFKWLYLASLISADTIVNKQTADRSLEKLQFIKENIMMFNLDAEERQDIERYINKGLEICKQDLKKYNI